MAYASNCKMLYRAVGLHKNAADHDMLAEGFENGWGKGVEQLEQYASGLRVGP